MLLPNVVVDMRIITPALLLILVLCGCQSVEETRLHNSVSERITRQIQEFNTANANDVVAARIKEGNFKFLGFSGVAPEPSFVPGLSQNDIRQLTNDKQYQWEIFYYYHGRTDLGSAVEEKALWDARVNYAERVNRKILEEIRKQPVKK